LEEGDRGGHGPTRRRRRRRRRPVCSYCHRVEKFLSVNHIPKSDVIFFIIILYQFLLKYFSTKKEFLMIHAPAAARNIRRS
jgi:hypothetical protein